MVIPRFYFIFGISIMFFVFILLLSKSITFDSSMIVNASSSSSSSRNNHFSLISHKSSSSHLHHSSHHQPSPLSKTPVTNDNAGMISTIPSNVANKVVILTFGDGYQSQYSLAKPVLDKYGYKGNFFVTCNRVGTANKMTWPELLQLYQEGNVIGSKTVDYGTKAMGGRDLNHLSAQQLEFEVGQSKQCLLNHGINTSFFAVPKNLANNNATVINEIAKYYTLAINNHSPLLYLNCNGGKIQNPIQTDCRTFFNNGTVTPENRYSIGEWSEQHIKGQRSYTDPEMFGKFIAVVNSQEKFNRNGVVDAIPLIAYHDIVLLPDVSLSSEPSATTLNLFNAEMKYLHDNGFKVLTFYNLGFDDKNNIFYLK